MMLQSLLFLALSMLFGNFFVMRTLEKSQRQKFLSQNMMTKIGTAFLCAQIAVLIIFFRHPLVSCVFVFLIPLILNLVVYIFYLRRDFLFQSEFPAIASLIILHMKDGNSFRKSIELCSQKLIEDHQFLIKQMLDLVVFSPQNMGEGRQQNKLFSFFLLNKLIKIDQESHKTIEKLETLKNNIQILNEFRRRSGKIRRQVYSQLLVIVGMYLAVSMTVIYLFGWEKNVNYFLSSFAFLIASCILSYQIGRKIKWSV